MPSWDRRRRGDQQKRADRALRLQVVDSLAPFSPYWDERIRAAGITAAEITDTAALRRVPAAGERDLCPDGDPARAARLVLQIDEDGWARHATGDALRRATASRLRSTQAYRRQLRDAIRPIAYHLGGIDLPLPIASTRDDLDVVARAGARLWNVLGLDATDLLVSCAPAGPLTSAAIRAALPYAALGAGAPAVHTTDPGEAGRVLAAFPATVLAVPDADTLDALGPLPDTVRTVLWTGDVDDPHGSARDALARVADGRWVRRVWGPPDGRWLWAECPAGGPIAGLHTYPDLEVLQAVDPALGTDVPDAAYHAPAGELVLTQLGVRGSALVRWRTGALLDALSTAPCPGCGRTVPRIEGIRPSALVTPASVGDDAVYLDLRALAGVLAARADLAGWQIRRRPDPRGGLPIITVAVATTPDVSPARAGELLVEMHPQIEDATEVGASFLVLDPAVAEPGTERLALH